MGTRREGGDAEQPRPETGTRPGPKVSLEAMLDSISDGFIILDRDYRCAYLNTSGEELIGFTREELVGRVIWDAFPHARGTRFETAYARVMDEGVSESFEEYYPEPLDKWIEVRAQPCAEGIVVYFRDVTERREREAERERLLTAERTARLEAQAAQDVAERAQHQLVHLASHDTLTGLPNRLAFERHTQRLLGRGPVTALYLDVDRFKLVNDALGHAAGDQLLVEVADRLSASLRPDDFAARLGGDEFVVVLPGDDPLPAQAVADRLLEALRLPVPLDHHVFACTSSIGIASVPAGTPVQTLLRNADIALYRGKDAGRDRAAWFDEAAHRQLLDRMAMEHDLRDALEQGRLQQHYQPMFDVATGAVVGVEALARWHHDVRGWVPPCDFIPLAEETGLWSSLCATVMHQAVASAASWARVPDFTVWFNVAGRQLDSPGLSRNLLALVDEHRLPPGRVGVEVTESVLNDHAVATQELRMLAEAGVPIAIDDFGTGYSSISRLVDLPLDVLKIDRMFVQRVHTDRGRAAVSMITQVADILGLSTVAEGIETEEQGRKAAELGVDVVSGFHLGRPMPAEDLEARFLGR